MEKGPQALKWGGGGGRAGKRQGRKRRRTLVHGDTYILFECLLGDLRNVVIYAPRHMRTESTRGRYVHAHSRH